MIPSDGSSSESDTGADLLDTILTFGKDSQSCSSAKVKTEKSTRGQSSQRKTSANVEPPADKGDTVAGSKPPQGLKLELKGLPLQVHPQAFNKGDGAEERLRLQPHQKLLRLFIDGDPNADPAALLSAYIASFGDIGQTGDLVAERKVQVEGIWYSVQRDACRGELLLGPDPSDTQLLTPERHLGHLRFIRCDPPGANQVQQEAEEDTSWETGPSFARFHKVQHYGTNVKPKKAKGRRA